MMNIRLYFLDPLSLKLVVAHLVLYNNWSIPCTAIDAAITHYSKAS